MKMRGFSTNKPMTNAEVASALSKASSMSVRLEMSSGLFLVNEDRWCGEFVRSSEVNPGQAAIFTISDMGDDTSSKLVKAALTFCQEIASS